MAQSWELQLITTARDAGAVALLNKTSQATQQLNQQLGSLSTISQRLQNMRFGLGSLVGGISAGLIIQKSISEFQQAQKEQRLLASTAEQSGKSIAAVNAIVENLAQSYAKMGVAGRKEISSVARQLISVGADLQDLPKLIEDTFRVAAAKGADADSVLRRLVSTLSDKTPEERLKAIKEGLANTARTAPQLSAIGDDMSKFKLQLGETYQSLGNILSRMAAPVLKDFQRTLENISFIMDKTAKSPLVGTLLEMAGAALKLKLELLAAKSILDFLQGFKWEKAIAQTQQVNPAAIAAAAGIGAGAGAALGSGGSGGSGGFPSREAANQAAAASSPWVRLPPGVSRGVIVQNAAGETFSVDRRMFGQYQVTAQSGKIVGSYMPKGVEGVEIPVTLPVTDQQRKEAALRQQQLNSRLVENRISGAGAIRVGALGGIAGMEAGSFIQGKIEEQKRNQGFREGFADLGVGWLGATGGGAAIGGMMGGVPGAIVGAGAASVGYSVKTFVTGLIKIAKTKEEIIKVNKAVMDSLARYVNTETKSAKELEAMTQEQRGAYIAALEKKREFWMASIRVADAEGKETIGQREALNEVNKAIRIYRQAAQGKADFAKTAQQVAEAEAREAKAIKDRIAAVMEQGRILPMLQQHQQNLMGIEAQKAEVERRAASARDREAMEAGKITLEEFKKREMKRRQEKYADETKELEARRKIAAETVKQKVDEVKAIEDAAEKEMNKAKEIFEKKRQENETQTKLEEKLIEEKNQRIEELKRKKYPKHPIPELGYTEEAKQEIKKDLSEIGVRQEEIESIHKDRAARAKEIEEAKAAMEAAQKKMETLAENDPEYKRLLQELKDSRIKLKQLDELQKKERELLEAQKKADEEEINRIKAHDAREREKQELQRRQSITIINIDQPRQRQRRRMDEMEFIPLLPKLPPAGRPMFERPRVPLGNFGGNRVANQIAANFYMNGTVIKADNPQQLVAKLMMPLNSIPEMST